ncbi:1,4-alpha-glucan branching enzyme [Pseudoflavonifractor sp. An176]|uniref:1,4-alpha-glucan branching protein GlgB n=1 Tax=Pseudoflavonifractor sp. An176 TaxID=1965572 RepID=UPI000B38C963|nr:1,4-alpha-glucan branching protein GlgB [Pseudoflavonifractor sp. An176]OUP66086.1 1,4-alpha-glucan branching enzyme [Pseudoflavonifractor sp. An176]
MDFYGFYTGQEFEAYRFLGAQVQGDGSVVFRTFAPNAASISVIGDFNSWQGSDMHKIYDGNFWELTVPQVEVGSRYKFRITSQTGKTIDHCDPYGFGSEKRPHTASVVHTLDRYSFQDGAWMDRRGEGYQQPLNIYEVHLGSWQRKSDAPDDWYTYEELAQRLIPYVKECGYNYIELMPLAEHPCDASWGYQDTGFFSPTSRYGTPDQLRFFIDQCHQNHIGVIMDFVPVHFAVDDYALWNYDGTPLYEYPNTAVGRSEWGSCNFMHSRGEVRSFLQSAALYWLKEFHVDGLRMDAVSNLIYWKGDPGRGENRGAIQFLQTMNQGLKQRLPHALLIAEDSTSYSGVTRDVAHGGLGFDYKWDLGWMNDTLSYFQTPPQMRPQHYHKLTFSMMYFYQERYLLPLSHDEVVHGKATILQKMHGDYEEKFPQARALYCYMMAHPGKKLNFMGNEIGQFREWDESREQDWNLLRYPKHDELFRFIRDLNHLYLNHSALWQEDDREQGFRWLDCHQEERCIYALERRSEKERLVFVFNFSDQTQDGYQLPVEGCAGLRPILSTEWEEYGGGVKRDESVLPAQHNQVQLSLPPYSGLCLAVEGE